MRVPRGGDATRRRAIDTCDKRPQRVEAVVGATRGSSASQELVTCNRFSGSGGCGGGCMVDAGGWTDDLVRFRLERRAAVRKAVGSLTDG